MEKSSEDFCVFSRLGGDDLDEAGACRVSCKFDSQNGKIL